MRKKHLNIDKYILILFILILWQLISSFDIIPGYMLPSPKEVLVAFIKDFKIIIEHTTVTFIEAISGLVISIIFGFLFAVLMDRYSFLNRAIYPIIVISQTIPTIAIAPILVLWFGFGYLPKILLIFSTCFFPITISILNGFSAIDKDMLRLMQSMDSTYFKTLFLVKIPYSLNGFFSGLKIATSYAIVGAVVSEWLGGDKGIGVYMNRVKSAYAFDKMFASIMVISLLTLIFVGFVRFLEKKIVYWKEVD